LSPRAKKKFKRDREDESDLAVRPEVKLGAKSCTALWAATSSVTEPVLTLEIGGEEFSFVVHTSAMVSLIQSGISGSNVQPCDVKARGVTGTQLDILGEQAVGFNLRSNSDCMSFVYTFVVSL